MKMFCKDLKEQAMKIINYEKKEMILLTDKEKESYENQEICYICEKEFCSDQNDKKKLENAKGRRSLSLHRKIERCCS